MNHRKLRIAWSVGCGIHCLLLIALWVRSYNVRDVLSRLKVSGDVKHFTALRSNWGRIDLVHFPTTNELGRVAIHDWKLSRHTPEPQVEAYTFEFTKTVMSFRAPYYFIVSIVAVVGAIPWVRWRFRLRTLLIVTTLIAVGLGIIAASI